MVTHLTAHWVCQCSYANVGQQPFVGNVRHIQPSGAITVLAMRTWGYIPYTFLDTRLAIGPSINDAGGIVGINQVLLRRYQQDCEVPDSIRSNTDW